MLDKSRPVLYAINLKKIKNSAPQNSYHGYMMIDGSFGPYNITPKTAIFIQDHVLAHQFAALYIDKLQNQDEWVWKFTVEEIPFPMKKHISAAEKNQSFLLSQLAKDSIHQVDVTKVSMPEKRYHPIFPRKRHSKDPKVFAIRVIIGKPEASKEGLLNVDLSIGGSLINFSTALFEEKELARAYVEFASSKLTSTEVEYQFHIEPILLRAEKARILATLCRSLINQYLIYGAPTDPYVIEVERANPKVLPEYMAPLRNFYSREKEQYYLCANLQLTDQSYRRAYFETEEIAYWFLTHASKVLQQELSGCQFQVKPVKLQPSQHSWLTNSMVSIKHALKKPMRPPKQRTSNRETRSVVLEQEVNSHIDTCFVVSLLINDEKLFVRQEENGDKSLITTDKIEFAKWYADEALALDYAKKIAVQLTIKTTVLPILMD